MPEFVGSTTSHADLELDELTDLSSLAVRRRFHKFQHWPLGLSCPIPGDTALFPQLAVPVENK